VSAFTEENRMQITMTGSVIDEGNGDAPLFYTVDGEAKQIPWSALHQLYEERIRETDEHHTVEQKLLARIVDEFWVDCDDWWDGATASVDVLPSGKILGCNYRGSHFGAIYPDAQCSDGFLWDEDSCDEPGGPLLVGGDIPCPKCNPQAAESA
jgi:hypothetical protein